MDEQLGTLVGKTAIDILRRLLETPTCESISVEEAGKLLEAMIPSKENKGHHYYASSTLANLVMFAANQIPYSHPSQLLLLQLLKRLEGSSKLPGAWYQSDDELHEGSYDCMFASKSINALY